jgi:hypothetical protein
LAQQVSGYRAGPIRSGVILAMNIYTVSAKSDGTGYSVEIEGSDGACQTTLGFASEAAANDWVARAKRLSKPWMPKADYRKPWQV